MRRAILITLALVICLPAGAQMSFRTTGEEAFRIFTVRPTSASLGVPPVSPANHVKFWVPDVGHSGYSAGNIYISQNGGAWGLLSSFVGAGAITSVFGRTGTITALLADYDTFYAATGQAETITGGWTFTKTTTPTILIKPASAPSANTKLFDMQATGAGVTNFAVDSEGDVTMHDITVTGALSGVGNVTGVASSVDSELALFSSTGGKTIKRATGTGLPLVTGGVLSTFTTSSGISGAISDETGSGSLVFGSSPTIVTPTIASFANATHNHTNSAGGGQITDAALSAPVTVAKGGAGVSMSATGGTGHVVKQASVGASFTTGTVNTADVTDNAVSNAKIRDGVATSVIGVTGSSTADPADIAATATNQFLWRNGTTLSFATAASTNLSDTTAIVYDSGNESIAGNKDFTTGHFERGRSVAAGEWTSVAYSAGNFTANGSMTWGVDSGDQLTYRYMLLGKTMWLAFTITATDITGTANNELRIAIPGGFTGGFRVDGAFKYHDAGASPLDGVYGVSGTGATYVALYKPNGINWTLTSADNTQVYGVIVIPVQ